MCAVRSRPCTATGGRWILRRVRSLHQACGTKGSLKDSQDHLCRYSQGHRWRGGIKPPSPGSSLKSKQTNMVSSGKFIVRDWLEQRRACTELLSLLERAPPPCTRQDAPEVKLCICRRQSVDWGVHKTDARGRWRDGHAIWELPPPLPLVGGGHVHAHGPVTNVAANFLFLGNSKHSMHISNKNNAVLWGGIPSSLDGHHDCSRLGNHWWLWRL
jgi:hypothetical protein